MMETFKLLRLILRAGCLMLVLFGCDFSQNVPSQNQSPMAHVSLIETLTQMPSQDVNGGLNSEKYLVGVKSHPVQGLPQSLDFYVQERTSQIKRFPCQECHVDPLETIQRQGPVKQAHWSVQLEHAQEHVMDCQTCHPGNAMNSLHLLNETKVGFDHSYQLCGQCHSKQIQEWAGGAHGKRLGGWAPPRVVKNCVECHNPHRPQLDKRWPSWSSSLSKYSKSH